MAGNIRLIWLLLFTEGVLCSVENRTEKVTLSGGAEELSDDVRHARSFAFEQAYCGLLRVGIGGTVEFEQFLL